MPGREDECQNNAWEALWKTQWKEPLDYEKQGTPCWETGGEGGEDGPLG